MGCFWGWAWGAAVVDGGFVGGDDGRGWFAPRGVGVGLEVLGEGGVGVELARGGDEGGDAVGRPGDDGRGALCFDGAVLQALVDFDAGAGDEDEAGGFWDSMPGATNGLRHRGRFFH